jgi:hypothetical protein
MMVLDGVSPSKYGFDDVASVERLKQVVVVGSDTGAPSLSRNMQLIGESVIPLGL